MERTTAKGKPGQSRGRKDTGPRLLRDASLARHEGLQDRRAADIGGSLFVGPRKPAEEVHMRLAQAVRWGLPLMGVSVAITPPPKLARTRTGEPSRTVSSDTTPLWRFNATSDITAFTLGPEGASVLYVLTKNGVLCLDAATGAQRWGREIGRASCRERV